MIGKSGSRLSVLLVNSTSPETTQQGTGWPPSFGLTPGLGGAANVLTKELNILV